MNLQSCQPPFSQSTTKSAPAASRRETRILRKRKCRRAEKNGECKNYVKQPCAAPTPLFAAFSMGAALRVRAVRDNLICGAGRLLFRASIIRVWKTARFSRRQNIQRRALQLERKGVPLRSKAAIRTRFERFNQRIDRNLPKIGQMIKSDAAMLRIDT